MTKVRPNVQRTTNYFQSVEGKAVLSQISRSNQLGHSNRWHIQMHKLNHQSRDSLAVFNKLQ